MERRAAMNLEGKRILVTGASSGIGRAVAVTAANLGATLVLTGRREDALAETRAALVRSETHRIISGDLVEASFAAALPKEATAEGPLDGFVHAAGICRAMPIGVVDERLLVESMQVNYFAFMLLMKSLSKKTFVRPGFSAVAVSSVSAEAGWAGGALYAGSKGAISAAVRALAVELAPKGIRVNAVCPSNVQTPLFDALVGSVPGETAKREALAAKQPLGLGEPEQVAASICFLLSDAASFITGTNLPVDGGYLAQ